MKALRVALLGFVTVAGVGRAVIQDTETLTAPFRVLAPSPVANQFEE